MATGALYFIIAIGMAGSPAILGSAMNVKYVDTLKNSLPAELSQVADFVP